MDRAAVLVRGRAAALDGMRDQCTIRRATGATSDDAGREETEYETLYSGQCRVKQAQAQAQREDVGEDHLLLLRLEVQLPVEPTAGLEVGDQIQITSAVCDPDLPGRVFLIHDLAHSSEITSRRVQCIERSG